jgi:pyruvate dehydrogenase E2 component (dihydrolipoamide acetyltransferase)
MSGLHVRDEGDERPLLLLHGLGASSRVFDHLFAPEVRGKRRLISVDLPNTARSRAWAKATPNDIAVELLRHLDSQRVSAFEVFGHSFGGLVALQLGALASQRVMGLTVANAPAMGLPTEFKLMLSNPMADMAMGWFGKMPVFKPMLRSYLAMIWGDARKLTDQHLEWYEEALSAPGFSESMLEALRAVGNFMLPHVALRAAPFPKHVIWGEKDRLVPAFYGEQLANAIGAKLEVLNDVGHCLPEEAPERLAKLVGS